MRMRRFVRLTTSFGICTILFSSNAAMAEKVVFARQLALSPDGKTLAFAWAGDVWSAPSVGGVAQRLTVHPADDGFPVWSPDGRWLAFASYRHGAANIFVMTAEGTELRRLTFSDRAEIPTALSPDGKYIYFHSSKNGEVSWEPHIYRVPVAGGQSWRVMEASGSHAVPSPDGRFLAFTQGVSPWQRTGYRGSANWDVWFRDLGTGEFTKLTDFAGTDIWPRWDERGTGLFFLSDREETHNVWHQPLRGGQPRKITDATGERIRDYTVSADGRKLVYTQWDKIFAMSLPNGRAQEIEITVGADLQRNPVELESFTSGAVEIAASPDGSEIALVVRGEIYVIKAESDKLTRRVTNSPARDWQVAWSPDGKALFFVSDAAGQEDIYRATSAEEPAKPLSDSLRFKIERVTDHPDGEFSPDVSPDGKRLLFLRNRGDLILRDLETGREECVLESWNPPAARWSPDGNWLAYAVADEEYNSDVWVLSLDPKLEDRRPVNISRHPDYDGNPQWSADGQMLTFASKRAGMNADMYLVFLSETLDEKSTVDLNDYFDKASKAAGQRKPPKECRASGDIFLGAYVEPESTPVEEAKSEEPPKKKEKKTPVADEPLDARLRAVLKEFLAGPKKEEEKKEDKDKDKAEDKPEKFEYHLDTAYLRLRRVVDLPEDQTGYALAPGGELLVFRSSHEGETYLFSVKWNGTERKRILSSNVTDMHWTLDGKRLFYNQGGRPASCTSSGGDSKTYSFRAKLAIDFSEEAAQKFNDAARMLGRLFYHPTMKDLDWASLAAQHRELALKTRTYPEFNLIFDLLQGRLNASHMGISGPERRSVERVGYLGCDFDAEFPGPGLKIKSITPRSPATRAESKLYPGDILLTVNGRPVGPENAIDAALIDTVNDQVIIEFLPAPDRPAEKTSAKSKPEQVAEPEASQPDSTATDPDDPHANLVDRETQQEPGDKPDENGPKSKELVIRPVNYGTFDGLSYEAWVQANRKYVEEKSEGRIGYLHIAGMGESQFHIFERDLYAAAGGKEGLIIDVRNNGGGWTADWILAVLNVQRHAFTVGRGGKPGYPQDRLIFYAWTKPATMMCNQCSYSNAEIISHAFKNLGRGPLVGVPTFGAVISTGSYSLVDGTTVRVPGRGWYTLPDGVDMENHPAVPDVIVPLTPADEEAGRKSQLDAAILATLERIAAENAQPLTPVDEPEETAE